MQHRAGTKPIKVVRTLEPTGKFTPEEIEAKLEEERQKRRTRSERFGLPFKEPTAEEFLRDGFVSKKRYYSEVEATQITGNLYDTQQVSNSRFVC